MTLVSDGGSLASRQMKPVPSGVEAAIKDSAIIECRGVTKGFGSTRVVTEVSFSLEPGEILAVLGPSGGGKTTLLRLMAGFEVPDKGSVTVEGQLVAGDGTWVPPEARRLGLVFQDYALFPHMTVAHNVTFGLKGWPASARSQRAKQVLEMVRLAHLADRYPHQLSGGEQQRVAVARSLAPNPLAILMDEPFSNLDYKLRLQVRVDVKNILRAARIASVFVTHYQPEAMFMGDRIAVMNEGRLEQVGTPEEIFDHPATRFVAWFMGTGDFIPAKTMENGLITEIGVLHPQIPLAPGTETEVMVRPDDVIIEPCATGLGKVAGRNFIGMGYIYSLALPSGDVVHSYQHHSVQYEKGAPMDVYLEPNQALTCFVNSTSAADMTPGQSIPVVTGERPRQEK